MKQASCLHVWQLGVCPLLSRVGPEPPCCHGVAKFASLGGSATPCHMLCPAGSVQRGVSLPQVDLLLTWGINRGIAWDAAAQGPRGITALHLAALQKDSAMADLLTGS